MIQRTFRDAAGKDLTLRICRGGVDGRQDKLRAELWWSLRWDDLENHLRRPDLPNLTRTAFEWALRHKSTDAA